MILKAHPSLLFDDCCKAALAAYCDIFQKKITNTLHMGDLCFPVPDKAKKRIFQLVFQTWGLYLACDTFPGNQSPLGANVYLSVDFSQTTQTKVCYEVLYEQGKVMMPFSGTEYSLGYGKVCDAFSFIGN